MNILTEKALQALTQAPGQPCVSLYMPAHRVGTKVDMLQDPIRLRNLLDEAEARLIAAGQRSPKARAQLAPARALIDDDDFWQHQGDGLAIFIGPDWLRHYCLPLEFEELLVVGNRFHLKPLLPLLGGKGRFYILTLSQNAVRLLHGSADGVTEIELKGISQNLAELLQYDQFEKQLQFHTGTPGGPGKRAAIFHGQGGGTNEKREHLLRYVRQIAKGISAHLKGETAPLILAGVGTLLAIYKQVNAYPHLVDQTITGSPEALSAEELRQKAWVMLQPQFKQAQEAARAHYQALAETQRASTNLRVIIPAARDGRVETLFVSLGQQQWGTYDPDTGWIQMHDQALSNDEDLLDTAAVQTLLNGGKVYAVMSDEMPNESLVAAVFRY